MNQINIRPSSSVYGTYKRLSYHPWSAISEFVDNSTQSYFDHKQELVKLPGFDKLKIEINYTSSFKGDRLEIIDNAYGMEFNDFERAIVLDSPPVNKSGRNEFGMGLKTAACWFGKKWTVVSTQFNSDNEYMATIDVDQLVESKIEKIDVVRRKVSKSQHYTKIIIENLNKKIMGKAISKVKETLSSTYRQDIRNNEVAIYYNGNKLEYYDPTLYVEKLENGKDKEWKKDIFFEIPYNGEKLKVHGYIAIRIPGSVKDAGFTLFRRGRVIIGGSEKNYRPFEVFGDANSYTYQRLFGELHLDDWPVTQAKDDFDWHDSALEEEFVSYLVDVSREFKIKAESIRVRKQINMSEVIDEAIKGFDTSEKIELSVLNKEYLNEMNDIQSNEIFMIPPEELINLTDQTLNQYETICESVVGRDDLSDSENLIIGEHKYYINMNFEDRKYLITVQLRDSDVRNWLVVEQNESLYNISINMRHRFFKPYVDKREFSILIVRFVIALVIAEVEAVYLSTDGRVEPSDIRIRMNDLLKELCDQQIDKR